MLEKQKDSIKNGDAAIITDIQKCSQHDGPGIRTMAFFKGCPLRCKWCQNPETWDPNPELMYCPVLCIKCGSCVAECPNDALRLTEGGLKIDRAKCTRCGKCSQKCYIKALKLAGTVMTVDELYEKLIDDEVFYKMSGGGVTLSGGECTMYPEYIIKLLAKLQERGIHTAIETCAYRPWEIFSRILKHVDLVLFDIKVPFEERSKEYVGYSNKVIIENLAKTRQIGKEVILRFPMVPGVNDNEASLKEIVRIANECNAMRINILPFHQMGASKWEEIGRPYSLAKLEPPTDDDIRRAVKIFENGGLDTCVGGEEI